MGYTMGHISILSDSFSISLMNIGVNGGIWLV